MTTLLAQLDAVLRYAQHNPYSAFYRTQYAQTPIPHHIESLESWRKVPTLTKEAMYTTPFWERIFTEPGAVDTLRNTSGTTGGSVLLVPRSKYTGFGYFPASVQVRGVLNFLAAHHIQERQIKMLWKDAIVVTGYPLYLEQSVRMAAHANVNVIQVFGFIIDALYPLLKKYHLTDRIELIEFMGERVTPAMWQKTKACLPRAEIIVDYGSSELQSVAAVAYPETNPEHICEYIPQQTHLIELLEKDTDTVIAEPDIEGELVITTLWTENNPFPLIRYRSGDAAKLIKVDENPWNCTYDILGRIHLDRIKITGGELRVEEVERVLAHYPELSEEFELHFYPDAGERKLPQIALKVCPQNDTYDVASLQAKIASDLRVSPTFTYQQGVEQGYYMPLMVTALKQDEKTKKTVRFFRH